jgi:hypothetical protein
MSDSRINPRILDGIREHSDDQTISEFLVGLILEEADHPGQWQWRETYKRMVEQYCEKWGADDEN